MLFGLKVIHVFSPNEYCTMLESSCFRLCSDYREIMMIQLHYVNIIPFATSYTSNCNVSSLLVVCEVLASIMFLL